MQTKYKLPSDVYLSTLWIIRGQERREKEYKQKKDDILNGGGAKYISYKDANGNDSRAYLPSARGNNVSETEVKALALAALEAHPETIKLAAVRQALIETTQQIKDDELKQRVQHSLMLNISNGKEYPFRCLNIPEFGKDKFYSMKSKFVYLVSKKIEKPT